MLLLVVSALWETVGKVDLKWRNPSLNLYCLLTIPAISEYLGPRGSFAPHFLTYLRISPVAALQ